MYTRDVNKMNAICINIVSDISTNFCIHFVYKIKSIMVPKICKPNVSVYV